MTAIDTPRAIKAVWRIESARLIAPLARLGRDVGLTEELAQDALSAARDDDSGRGMQAAVGRAAHPGNVGLF